MTWGWVLTNRADKDLFACQPADRERIIYALDSLGRDRGGADVQKLQGRTAEYRLRVGQWRIRFAYDRTLRLIIVLRVLRRNEATYRD
jgi:mRNA-degrading endonuclease RelE of RelBE toxin-antitoxin system